jgi:hypothetical protein
MNREAFIEWLAQDLAGVLMTPTTNDQRLLASRTFIATFAARLRDVPANERQYIGDLLHSWYRKKQIDGYTISRDDETMDWLEAIVGTIDGVIEAEE